MSTTSTSEVRFFHFDTYSDFSTKKVSFDSTDTSYTIGISGTRYPGDPDIPWGSIVYIKDTQQQWTHGKLYNDPEILYGTYDEIFALYQSKSLIPGRFYAITDYTCSYIHPSSGNDEKFEITQPADDVECLILTALRQDHFDYNIQYVRKEGYAKILECKYFIDPEDSLIPGE